MSPLSTNLASTSNRPASSHFYQRSPKASPQVGIVTLLQADQTLSTVTAQAVFNQSFQNFQWFIISPSPIPKAKFDLNHQTDQVQWLMLNEVAEALAPYNFVWLLNNQDSPEPTFLEKCLWFLEAVPENYFCTVHSAGQNRLDEESALNFHNIRAATARLAAPPSFVMRQALFTILYEKNKIDKVTDWATWLALSEAGYQGYVLPDYSAQGITVAQNLSDDQIAFQTIPTQIALHNPLKKTTGYRILMFVPWFKLGGADKFNLDLVEQLIKQDVHITLVATRTADNEWLPYFQLLTPDIFLLHHFLPPVDYPRFLSYLIESRQIDTLIVTNSELGYRLLPYLRSRHPHLVCLDYIHMEALRWKNGGYPRLGIGYQELLDLNIVSTHHLKAWMEERGGEAGRIKVCHTNIDPTVWDPACFERNQIRQQLALPLDIPLILYAGRITQQKRPRLFAEVIRRLALEEPGRFICLVAGDGEDLPYLRSFVATHRLDEQVRFLGAVPNEQIRQLLAAADIFFLPSEIEGLSLALFEAMAMEAVPVAAAVGGQEELVTPACGYLIPPTADEVDKYVEALKQLITSPQKRTKLASAGRQRIIEHFSIDKLANQMAELLKDARKFSQNSPRPAVGQGLGLETATLAVEYARLENEYEQVGAYIAQFTDFSRAEDVARRMPVRRLLRGLWLKVLIKSGLYRPASSI